MSTSEYSKLADLVKYGDRNELEEAAQAFVDDYDWDSDCFDPQEATFDAFIEGAIWLLDHIQKPS